MHPCCYGSARRVDGLRLSRDRRCPVSGTSLEPRGERARFSPLINRCSAIPRSSRSGPKDRSERVREVAHRRSHDDSCDSVAKGGTFRHLPVGTFLHGNISHSMGSSGKGADVPEDSYAFGAPFCAGSRLKAELLERMNARRQRGQLGVTVRGSTGRLDAALMAAAFPALCTRVAGAGSYGFARWAPR